MKFEIFTTFNTFKVEILNAIINFNCSGILFADGQRNKIKLFKIEDQTINIKSFKTPNFFNQIVYKYFRDSKAKRSFKYAKILKDKNIGVLNDFILIV